MIEVFWDLETKRWFDEGGVKDLADLGVSIVSVLWRDGQTETLQSFWEHQFPDMWKVFRQADRIIGFNTVGFDLPVIKPYAPADFAKLPHFDIYLKIKEQNNDRAAGLGAIVQDTLGLAKTDSGENAIYYWQKGDSQSLALLQKYCEADVLLTRDIYDFGLKNKFLKFTDRWNNPRTAVVDFSYPDGFASATQSSLF